MTACRTARTALCAFVDGALPGDEHQAMAAHLDACERCRADVAALTTLRALVASTAPDAPMPPALVGKVSRALGNAREREAPPLRTAWKSTTRTVAALAAGIAALGLLAAIAVRLLRSPDSGPAPSRLVAELVDDHVRYLASPNPGDVDVRTSSEAARFFDGKLTCSVPVPEAAGVSLRAARLCYVLDRRVALLFYQGGHGRVSLFVIPDHDHALAREIGGWESGCRTGGAGYSLCAWPREKMVLVAVGESAGDLRSLAAVK